MIPRILTIIYGARSLVEVVMKFTQMTFPSHMENKVMFQSPPTRRSLKIPKKSEPWYWYMDPNIFSKMT